MLKPEPYCPVNYLRQTSRYIYHAPLRAFTAAQIILKQTIIARTLVDAANSTGSNLQYVRAAIVLQQAENNDLVVDVLSGRISILAAAAQVRTQSNLIQSYRAASPADRIALARAVGAERMFDEVLSPAAE